MGVTVNPKAVFSALKTKLKGLSTAVATAVTESDNILQAVGKLQGQIVNNAALLPPFFDTAWYKSNHYYDAAYPYYSALSPTTGATGSLYFNKRKILADMTVIEIGVNVTAGVADSQILYGIYSSDENGRPSTLLASGSASSDTTGSKTSAVSVVLKKGDVVWDAFLSVGGAPSAMSFTPVFCDGGLSATANGYVLLVKGGQTSLPADASLTSFSSLTTSKLVRVVYKAA